MEKTKFLLSEKDIPQQWYNVAADLPFPLPPPIHPGTKKPLNPSDLAPIFPMSLIRQEMSRDKWIDIPDEVRQVYGIWRPTPLKRAVRLEKALKTKCRIYFKDESVSPAGSHKPNTAVPQAYYNKKEGVKCLCTETGAGQWGSALSFACHMFGLKCRVYMVKVSYHQKPFRKSLMHIWGSEVIPSPSDLTESGKMVLKQDPHCQGSLGIAISEAVEDAVKSKNAHYALGSVLNHVLLHQTVIGLETKMQLKLAGEKPDYLLACVGGGSNFGGFAFPFVKDRLKNGDLRIIAVEPTACPSLTKGLYAYDFGDIAGLTPLLKMCTLGYKFIPAGIHAGGLRYHGMSPMVSALYAKKIIEAVAVEQLGIFQAARLFAETEGTIPAPETAHAIKAAIDVAKREKKSKCIVFNFSGHGFLDLASYDKFMSGELTNYAHPVSEIKKALSALPKL
ncbi:MAG: TrpB-like pyridoxal phosphate-dependent enzyme [Candidatus Omnitrophica bacterium]|jgi:tryptophan synthase beta chain|nr:TrpB-like pyridoxal phosphate-dependent enzyme [Candidatus Omnitrophota bacterium]MDD5080141.1 TrpB-like pyridoxal phosphate-dependent enzyme [Candidatus Omnitrophota bacterium]